MPFGLMTTSKRGESETGKGSKSMFMTDHIPAFPTKYEEILDRIDAIDPVSYGRTRNFVDGDITFLSPYISRGVISTRFVAEKVLAKGYAPGQIIKFLQELAWRDYWQNQLINKGIPSLGLKNGSRSFAEIAYRGGNRHHGH